MVRGVRMRFVGGGGGNCGEVGARLEEVTFVPALFACCFEGGARGEDSLHAGVFGREGRGPSTAFGVRFANAKFRSG